MEPLDIFRENIKKLTHAQTWTQNDLAKRTGIKQASLSKYISGKKNPSVETCEKIAKAFGLTISEVFSSNSLPKSRVEHHTLHTEIREAVHDALDMQKILQDPSLRELIALWPTLDESQQGLILGAAGLKPASLKVDNKLKKNTKI